MIDRYKLFTDPALVVATWKALDRKKKAQFSKQQHIVLSASDNPINNSALAKKLRIRTPMLRLIRSQAIQKLWIAIQPDIDESHLTSMTPAQLKRCARDLITPKMLETLNPDERAVVQETLMSKNPTPMHLLRDRITGDVQNIFYRAVAKLKSSAANEMLTTPRALSLLTPDEREIIGERLLDRTPFNRPSSAHRMPASVGRRREIYLRALRNMQGLAAGETR